MTVDVIKRPRSETYNCDCMDWLRQRPSLSIDLAIIDPPYGLDVTRMRMGQRRGHESTVSRLSRRRKGCGYHWDAEPAPREFFDELFRVSRNQIIWGGNYFALPPTRCVCVWDKLMFADSFSQVEVAWTSFDRPSRIFRKGAVGGDNLVKKIHPTQKPVELYGWLLKEFANEGDVILDTHMGSQSSRIAAYKMGFDYFGCEIDHDYFMEGEARFRSECLGVEKFPNGKTVTQMSLF